MMFKKLVAGIILFLGIASVVLAIPQYLNYQGILRDASGRLITGTKAMKFRIYDDATASAAGNLKLEMTSAEVAVSNGLYNVEIGPAGYAELASGRRWLEVEVGGETLSPRTELLAVAYAVTAVTAETAVYAYTAGSASTASSATTAANATNADTVDSLSASSTPTGGQLLALDSNKQLKTSISAEAQGNPFALFVNGRLGAGGVCVGTGEILATESLATVTNPNLTSSSIVLGSGGVNSTFDPGKSYIYRKDTNKIMFEITNVAPTGGYPFRYIIIN